MLHFYHIICWVCACMRARAPSSTCFLITVCSFFFFPLSLSFPCATEYKHVWWYNASLHRARKGVNDHDQWRCSDIACLKELTVTLVRVYESKISYYIIVCALSPFNIKCLKKDSYSCVRSLCRRRRCCCCCVHFCCSFCCVNNNDGTNSKSEGEEKY